jgi:hypothetical protein
VPGSFPETVNHFFHIKHTKIMTTTKLLIEATGQHLQTGIKVQLVGKRIDVAALIWQAMDQDKDVAEAVINGAAKYLQAHPELRKSFAQISGIN